MTDSVAPPAYSPSESDSGEIISNYKPIGGDEYTPPSGYMDNNGNVWDKIPQLTEDGYTTPNLLVHNSVTNDPLLKATGLDPFQAKEIYSLKETDPHAYYSQIGNALESKIYSTLFDNSDSSAQKDALEQLKTLDPQAYYQNKIKFESQAAGWDAAQNEAGRSAGHQNAVQALVPDAIKAGLSTQEINDLYSQSASQASRDNQKYIANRKNTFWADNLKGAIKVGSLAAGAYGLDSALAAGAASALGSGAELAGPTYGELGITGVEGGFAGPTYAEMGYTGLNQAEAIAAADAAAKGLTGAEALKYVNTALKGISTASQLAKLLSAGSAKGITSGTNATNITNALRSATQPVQEQFGGLYRMNQNPFLQAQQSTNVQTPFKQHDFLAELAQEGQAKTPTLADLLRNA